MVTMRSGSNEVQKGTIFVEVQIDRAIKENASNVERFVRKALRLYKELRVGERIDLRSCELAGIQRVEVTGYSLSKDLPDHTLLRLDQNHIDVSVYFLFGPNDEQAAADNDLDVTSPDPFRILPLPHEAYEGLWDALVYDQPVKELCLRALSSAINERLENDHARVTDAWQNTVLLYGPPGSGKTTMAQAIAQRLSVRFVNRYNGSQMLQIHAPALLSHLWGETVKRIGDLFRSVVAKAQQEQPLLVIVLLDEVETFAACREKSMLKSEPSDAVKATAELLRGLDECRTYENIVFMFTSNFISALDEAFLDRIRIRKRIDLPDTYCVFEILRKEINHLMDQGLIEGDSLLCHNSENQPDEGAAETTHDQLQPIALSRVPTLDWARSNWPATAHTAVSEIMTVATMAEGISPRSAKGLLELARHEYLVERPAKLQDALTALRKVLMEEADQGLRSVGSIPTGCTTLCTGNKEEQNIAELVSDLLTACQPR